GKERGRARRRASPDCWRARDEQDAVVSFPGWPVAVGLGQHHSSKGPAHLLFPARITLSAARDITRGAGLPAESREFRLGCLCAGTRPARARSSRAAAGYDAAMGSRIECRRADIARLRTHRVAEAPVGARG